MKWIPRPQHYKACKALFETEEGFEPYTVDEVIQHQDNYFRDPFWRKINYDFMKFCQYFDRYAPRERRKETPLPASVQGLLRGVAESIRVGVSDDPNEKYRCKACREVHSPNAGCQV